MNEFSIVTYGLINIIIATLDVSVFTLFVVRNAISYLVSFLSCTHLYKFINPTLGLRYASFSC